ncbi:MAG: SH3 domain-containing protein [Chloroflexi bacterium]|nr:SH3 domain-containing protein [Chloroflexota bacterium]
MMFGKCRLRPDFGVRAPGRPAAAALRASILLALLAVALAVPAQAQEAEYAVPGGRFFTQTGGDTPDPGDGYAVVDDSEARFWTAFEEFGGVAEVGYPVSRRFIWDGFVTQVMQKAVFQWRPGEQATAFVNVFDDLHRLGYDARLADELVPEQEDFDESGLAWPQILEQRIALLDEEPLLRRVYLASGDYLRHFGLPTSRVRNYSGLRAIRLQRAVLQLWLDDFPWARAGTVTVANGGDLAKQLGLFPQAALAPHAPNVVPATLPAGSQAKDFGTGRWFVDTEGSFLNVRQRPSVSAPIVDSANDGEEVFPTGRTIEAGGLTWVEIGTARWVSGEFLSPQRRETQPVDPPTPVTPPTTGTDYSSGSWQANVPGSTLNVRAQPSRGAQIVARFQHGRVLDLTGNTESVGGETWLELNVNGAKAWVVAEFVAPVTGGAQPVTPGTGDSLIEEVNRVRSGLGLSPLVKSDALTQAASSHALYWITNRGDFHNETAGLQHFTGVSIFDRAKAANYELNWIDEVAGLLDPARTLDWALSTVYHRYMFVHPSAVHIGYGSASDGNVTVSIFNVGLQFDRSGPNPQPSIYPADGTSAVPPQWDGFERPDPAPGVPRPLGPPITVLFRLGDDVTWGQASLTRLSDGAVLPATNQTSAWRKGLSLVPHDPLGKSETYRFNVSWTVNGVAGTSSSTFTTASQ